MKSRLLVLSFVAILLFAFPAAVGAGHGDDPSTDNVHNLGHDEAPASLFFGPTDVHTDIAFWGAYGYQGNWNGFRILDISAPGNPVLLTFERCEGNQGDVVVWDNILVRSWNSPAPGNTLCDGQVVPAGFEGVHVFDVSDVSNPVLVASVETECGSHTATGVPDLENNRLLIYNSPSSGVAACRGIDIIEVPLDDPGSASLLRFEPSGRSCHDTGVILGDAMLAACAGGNGFTVWNLAGPGGSLEDPEFLYSVVVPGVTVGHSAAFSWDGDVLIFGHEPGGGVAAECEANDPAVRKSFFFYNSANGSLLGQWVLPRPQSNIENCTLHNYNAVPLRTGNDVIVHGSYQSGTSVVDFTDPTAAYEVGYSDPPPIVPTDLGGAWSTYWYNNFMYETNITEGLNIFRLSDEVTAAAMRLDHLNPQTQEFTIE